MAAADAVRIWYIGPGEAESDLSRQLSHRAVDPPLTEHGREQVERLAAGLAGQGLGLHPEIFSSPLKRAQETATIIGSGLGLSVVADERLREVNVGDLDGRTDEDAWRMHTEIVHRRWSAGEWSRRFPGGEHLRNLAQRYRSALLAAARSEIGTARTDVLVIGHGTGLRAALPYLIKNVADAYPHNDLGHGSITCFSATPTARPAVLQLLAWEATPADVGRLVSGPRPGWESM